MKKRFTTLLFTGIITCLLSACSTLMDRGQINPEFNHRKIGKTMILGLAVNDSMSLQYEMLFTQHLTPHGVSAQSLHALVPNTDTLSREELVEILKKQNVDSILVTRILSEEEQSQVVIDRDYNAANYGSHYDHSRKSFTPNYNAPTEETLLKFELETNLYDVKTQQIVWSGKKTVYDDRSNISNMKKVIHSVVRDLKKNDLLQ